MTSSDPVPFSIDIQFDNIWFWNDDHYSLTDRHQNKAWLVLYPDPYLVACSHLASSNMSILYLCLWSGTVTWTGDVLGIYW